MAASGWWLTGGAAIKLMMLLRIHFQFFLSSSKNHHLALVLIGYVTRSLARLNLGPIITRTTHREYVIQWTMSICHNNRGPPADYDDDRPVLCEVKSNGNRKCNRVISYSALIPNGNYSPCRLIPTTVTDWVSCP